MVIIVDTNIKNDIVNTTVYIQNKLLVKHEKLN